MGRERSAVAEAGAARASSFRASSPWSLSVSGCICPTRRHSSRANIDAGPLSPLEHLETDRALDEKRAAAPRARHAPANAQRKATMVVQTFMTTEQVIDGARM